MKLSGSMQGHLAALFTAFLWGTTFVSTKLLLESFTPLEILFSRFAIGFLVLCIAYPRRLKGLSVKQEMMMAGAGLCGVTLYFLMENIALSYTLVSNVAVILSVAPFFTALLAHLLLDGERLSPSFFVGLVFALVGISLISFGGSELRIGLTGDLLALGAAIVWGFYSILTRKIGGWGYHVVQTTRRIFFYGVLFMIPALFFLPFQLDLSRFAVPANLFHILYLGVGASAFGFATWNFAIRRLGAIQSSTYIYLVPIVSIVVSALVLGERIGLLGFFGVALTLTGLFLSELGTRRAAKRARNAGQDA